MIHLALWLVSLCVVAFFGFLILAAVANFVGYVGRSMFRSDSPKQLPTRITAPDQVSEDTPRWVYVAGYIALAATFFVAGAIADEMSRKPSPMIAPWVCVALGIVGGLIANGLAQSLLMGEVMHARRIKAGRARAQEVDRQEERLRARADARATAITAYPDYLDDDVLLDPGGAYAWPEELFEELFVVPDIVVPFTSKFGDTGEIRLWSKIFVAQQSSEPAYVAYREKLDRERQREEEQRRQEEEELRQVEERERELAEIERKETEALAARKARQMTISVEELKKGR